MRFIDSTYEIINQEPGVLGIYKQIEKAARTSYKSEDRITDNSAQKMVDTLIKNKHYACLEHGTVYLLMNYDQSARGSYEKSGIDKYIKNPYSRVVFSNTSAFVYAYITTNPRVIIENGWQDDLKYICEPTEHHAKRVTVKFTCSIGVGREMIRHRVFSFMQESTRYCNYSKDKFGNQLTIIIPQWIYDCQQYHSQFVDSLTGDSKDWILREDGERLIHSLCCEDRVVSSWYELLKHVEEDYNYYVIEPDGYKLKPQEARGILPLDLKSELVMTGFVDDWKHFFALRSYIAATGKPHPDIQVLADSLLSDFIELKYITAEEIAHLKNEVH